MVMGLPSSVRGRGVLPTPRIPDDGAQPWPRATPTPVLARGLPGLASNNRRCTSPTFVVVAPGATVLAGGLGRDRPIGSSHGNHGWFSGLTPNDASGSAVVLQKRRAAPATDPAAPAKIVSSRTVRASARCAPVASRDHRFSASGGTP